MEVLTRIRVQNMTVVSLAQMMSLGFTLSTRQLEPENGFISILLGMSSYHRLVANCELMEEAYACALSSEQERNSSSLKRQAAGIGASRPLWCSLHQPALVGRNAYQLDDDQDVLSRLKT